MKKAAVLVGAVVLIASLGGCASEDSRMSLLRSCDTYASTLSTVSAAAARGQLTAAQIQSVQEIREIINPICGSPPNGTDGAALALGTVQNGLEQLVFYNSTFGDAR